MSELLKKCLPLLREAYGSLDLDRMRADAANFTVSAKYLTLRIQAVTDLIAEVEAAVERCRDFCA